MPTDEETEPEPEEEEGQDFPEALIFLDERDYWHFLGFEEE